MKPEELIDAADRMIKAEAAESAIPLLNSFLMDTDNPRVWLKLARIYLVLGEEIVARAILRNVIRRIEKPHVLYLIAAKVPFCKPLVLDSQKLLYFNIPKCGSSSFKDAILIREGEAPKQERSHFFASKFEKVLSFAEIDANYADYRKLVIIRHPRERLRSYWKRNVTEAGSLSNEAGGRRTYYGLPVRPAYDQMIANFARYRGVFLDFRHHTDSIVGYVGQNRSRLTNIFGLDELPEALKLLNLPAGLSLENMKSRGPFDGTSIDEAAESHLVDSHYHRELELFFPAGQA